METRQRVSSRRSFGKLGCGHATDPWGDKFPQIFIGLAPRLIDLAVLGRALSTEEGQESALSVAKIDALSNILPMPFLFHPLT